MFTDSSITRGHGNTHNRGRSRATAGSAAPQTWTRGGGMHLSGLVLQARCGRGAEAPHAHVPERVAGDE
jgi:hypothetical protein